MESFYILSKFNTFADKGAGIRDTFFLFIQHGFSEKIVLTETEGKQTQVPVV